MSLRNALEQIRVWLRAATGYVCGVVAINLGLLLVVAVWSKQPVVDLLALLLSAALVILLCIGVFAFALFLTLVPFYLFRRMLSYLRLDNGFFFVLGGGISGGVLVAGLFAGSSLLPGSGSANWEVPLWIAAAFSLAGGFGGLVFWLVEVGSRPPWRLRRP
jgi:hypothetical protein